MYVPQRAHSTVARDIPAGCIVMARLAQALFALFCAICMALSCFARAEANEDLHVQGGDYVIHDFHFADGETLPEVRIHYRTLGTLQRDANGHATNVVLLLHDTISSGESFLTPLMKRELFVPGVPLDAQRYFIVMPDNLGHGGSSKPSDGLRARFPHYGYTDAG